MSPVRFGLFVPQVWIGDLVDIEDPIELEALAADVLPAFR